MLKNISHLEDIPSKLQKVFFEKVFHIAEVSNYSLPERQQYEESLKYYRDYHNTMAFEFKKGKIEGKIETAKNLKDLGFTMDVIIQATGLSEEEIKQVLK
ncbi:MAG: hypothetical protein HC913_17975 [Microscillaceae bacterium]|nr:hypothetical protein [Microscillaceae bacterium]